MDDLEFFDRSLGLNPFLILDGHGSRFELCFLEYINNPETKWHVNIGLPYGTSYWQVGDSSQQNGQFKMALTVLKQALVTMKNDLQYPFCIEKHEVIKLVKDAWHQSFSKVLTNKTAIAQRGWGPLNRNALLHPEISCTNTASPPVITAQSSLTTSTVAPEELNLSEGLAGTVINRIVAAVNKDARVNQAPAEAFAKRKASAKEAFIKHESRITAGRLASAGKFSLDSDVLELQRGSNDEKQAKCHKREKKRKAEYDALFVQIQDLKQKNLSPEDWTVPKLTLMIRWYRRPEDAALPKTKKERLVRYYESFGRGDPQVPELLTKLPSKRAVPDFFLPSPLPLLPTASIASVLDGHSDPAEEYVEALALNDRATTEDDAPIAEEIRVVCCCGDNCDVGQDAEEEPDCYCYSCGGYCHENCCIMIGKRNSCNNCAAGV